MIIIEPVKTEKAIKQIEEQNTLTFIVSDRATKKEIKEEVERLFGVKVKNVRTQITSKGKKRAFVRLEKEHKAEDVALKLKMIG